MSEKVTIDKTDYRCFVYAGSRGYCFICNDKDKQAAILLRVFNPIKKEYRVCYKCLLQMFLDIERHREIREEANRQAYEARVKALEKARQAKAEKKERENGTVLQDVDDTETQVSETEKKNDGNRTGSLRPESCTTEVPTQAQER